MILIAISVLFICIFQPIQAMSADVKEELQGVTKEIKEKKLLIKKTKKVENLVSNELVQIEKNLHEKESTLNALSKDLKGVELVLNRTRIEIESVRAEAERKQKQIRSRLASLYKAGELGTARTFFSSESLPQMVENIRYMQSVLVHDRKLFDEYNDKVEKLKLLKVALEKDLNRKEKIKSNIVDKKREIEDEKNKKAEYLKKVREEKRTHLASLRELEANARRLQSMIERLEAKSRKSYSAKTDKKRNTIGSQTFPKVPDKGFGALKGKLSLPVKGEISSRFGRHKHPQYNSFTVSNGISITAPLGTDIKAVYDGQVIFADYFKGYGNMVIVDHGGGFFSLYAHASRLSKKVGSMVSRNDIVASVGDSDSTKGPMLYFEIRYQGKPVDPTPWFR
jgi:septal ring factor EnvC (AmiA/AmiB activator)